VPEQTPIGPFPNRREFIRTAGALTAGAAILPYLGCSPNGGPLGEARAAAEAGWIVRPFPLDRVALGPGVFRDKRDRMLNYARNYGSETDPFAGPDRLLSIFRANAGLDTRGAEPVGSWENATGYLRGHYAGHFMSMLAQAHAGTGEAIYKRKLDYMVAGLAECQQALAAAARLPTPRVQGRFGGGMRLSGSPIGSAEHIRIPEGTVDGLTDFTVATWIRPEVYERGAVSDPRRDTIELINHSAVFSFGSPNPEYAEAPLSHMYLTLRVSNEHPVPRFAITTSGDEGEQGLDGAQPIPMAQWTHLAVTREGGVGTLYVNGAPVARNPDMTLSPADLGTATDNWLGRHQFPQRNVSYLNATLDEFQLFSRALDPGEVRSLMDTPGGSAGGGDVVWYRFDEDDGPTAVDASGNGLDATIIAPTDGRRHPGFLSAYPETQFIRLEEFARYGGSQGIWAPYYTLHKIMAGLIDAHVHTGNGEALDVLSGIGDWVYSRVAPLRQEQLDRMWDIYIAGEYGGVNESLATLHSLRPDRPEYLEAAGRFVNNNVYLPSVADEDVLDGRHANQHIPQFTGYLRIFEQGHDSDYFSAARNFWGMVVPHRTYSHGGMGVGEMFRERDVIAGSLFEDRNHAETCPLYNMLKLSRNLFFHEADPRYMDYYETGLFNQILGSRRDMDSAESPEVTYFVPVQPGQRRSYGNVGTCCGGTGMENHTKYQDSIYFRSVDDSALFVNLYISSTLHWPEKGFTVTQESRFPREGVSTFTVDGSGNVDVRLRVPGWARRGFHVRINGEPMGLDPIPGTYLNLTRRWSPGDTVEVEMPFAFRVERALDDPSVQSIYYGPILLAAQAEPEGEGPATGFLEVELYRHLKLDGDLGAAMTPAGEALHFNLGGLALAPFYVADPASVPPAPPAGADAGADRGRSRGGPPTQPYHVYLRRREPRILFGSVDSGVDNSVGPGGLTFLDVLWDEAPFPSHDEFLGAVDRIGRDWEAGGMLTPGQRASILDAARRAEEDLRV